MVDNILWFAGIAVGFIILESICIGTIKIGRTAQTLSFAGLTTACTAYIVTFYGLKPEYCWFLLPIITIGLPVIALFYQTKHSPGDKSR